MVQQETEEEKRRRRFLEGLEREQREAFQRGLEAESQAGSPGGLSILARPELTPSTRQVPLQSRQVLEEDLQSEFEEGLARERERRAGTRDEGGALVRSLEELDKALTFTAGHLTSGAVGIGTPFYETPFEIKERELREQGLSPFRATMEAFRQTDLPSARVPLVPFGGIPLPGGRKLERVDLGVKGAIELLADPLNVIPGVGFAKFGRGPVQAAGRGASRAAPLALPPPSAVVPPPGTLPPPVVTPLDRVPLGPSSVSEPLQLAAGAPTLRPPQPLGVTPPPSRATQALMRVEESPQFILENILAREPLTQTASRTIPSTPAGLMAPQDAENITTWFGNIITSPESIQASEVAQVLQRAERARRFADYEARVSELVSSGVSPEDAMRQARSALRGELPRSTTGMEAFITQEVKDALYARVYLATAGDIPAQLSTVDALTKAIQGRPITRTPGVRGGSMFSRLSAVFPPDVVAALSRPGTLDRKLFLKFSRPRGVAGVGSSPAPGFGTPPPQVGLFDRLSPADPLELRSPTQPGSALDRPIPGRVIPPSTAAGRRAATEDLRLTLSDLPQEVIGGQPAPPDTLLNRPQGTSMFDDAGGIRIPPADAHAVAQRRLDREALEVGFGRGPQPPRDFGSAFPAAGEDALDEAMLGQMRLADELLTPKEKSIILRSLSTAGLQLADAGNLLRAHISGPDMSWLRQQALLIPDNNRAFSQAFYDSLRSIWSQGYARRIDRAIKGRPVYQIYEQLNARGKQGRDFLRPLEGPIAGQWEAAEDSMILFRVSGETRPRPIQRLAEKLPWLRVSNRAFVTGINSMNWRIFEEAYSWGLQHMEDIGSGLVKMPPGEAFDLFDHMDNIATFLADWSGRGPIPEGFKGAAPYANASFFSVRNNIGRAIMPRHLFVGSSYVKRKAWKSFIKSVGLYSSFILAGREMGLWDVETDNRSADFMKIRIGPARIDAWGGMQQFAVLYGRLLSVMHYIPEMVAGDVSVDEAIQPRRKSTTTGQVSDAQDPLVLVGGALRNKAAPLVSTILREWTARDFKGSEVDRTDMMQRLVVNSPFIVQDVIDGFRAFGLTGLPLGIAGAFGAGVQVYELPRWPELDEYYTIRDRAASDSQADRMRDTFRNDPENEARLFIRGQFTRLRTGARGRAVVRRLMEELNLSPNDVSGYEREFGPQ